MEPLKCICIHGHFYQPPRENPWLEEIERQPSAHPYHDWNDRIAAECYAPNARARTLDDQGQISALINNYSRISFNFGPTLLTWLEHKRPDTYAAILEADRLGQERFSGHGPAMAQAYNHMLMPLANESDQRTQILWGIEDFKSRYKRDPEGMWLPETAVNVQLLEVMAECGIRFTVLAPRQASKIRKMGDHDWLDVKDSRVDPRRPYLCRLPSGKTIHLFFYDGNVSQEIAFGDLLKNGENFVKRLMSAIDPNWQTHQLMHIATDGESYGHHMMHGDMTLAYSLNQIEAKNLAKLTIYGEFLDLCPAEYEVEIFENSSWSCVHGVERWRSNCGCNSGGKPNWNQEWRAPLRAALDDLRDKLISIFDEEGSQLFKDTWEARNHYIHVVLNRTKEEVDKFLNKHTSHELDEDQRVKCLKLLEMQRHAMLMYTSCGWFFDEISGIETVQILQYAARAIQLAEEITTKNLEDDFLLLLGHTPSNIPEFGNGAVIYEKFVKTAKTDLLRVAIHYAISSIFKDYPKEADVFCYRVESETHEHITSGRQQLVIGKASLKSLITEEETDVTYAVVHLGDHNLMGGVRFALSGEAFNSLHKKLCEAFRKMDIPQSIRIMDKNFPDHTYSIWHLFKDEQERVLDNVLAPTLLEMETSLTHLYDDHYSLMSALKEAHIPTPPVFTHTVEFVIHNRLRKCLEINPPDLEILETTIDEMKKWKPQLDHAKLSLMARRRVQSLFEQLVEKPSDVELLVYLENFLSLLRKLPFHIDFWQAQNIFFDLSQQELPPKAVKGEKKIHQWLDTFKKIQEHLHFHKDKTFRP